MQATAPPRSVLVAFATDGPPEPLPGGRGTSWAAGGLVLKPLDRLPAQIEWEAVELAALVPDGFRVAVPQRSVEGALVVDGWTAWNRLEGVHEARWAEIVQAGDRFHRALASQPRPPFLDGRTDPWSIGERAAWE